jgi:hypothetical protein
VCNQVIDYWAFTLNVDEHALHHGAVLDRQVRTQGQNRRKCCPNAAGYTSLIGACAVDVRPEARETTTWPTRRSWSFASSSTRSRTTSHTIWCSRPRGIDTRGLCLFCRDNISLGEMAYNRVREAVTKDVLLSPTTPIGEGMEAERQDASEEIL